jgi:hypothetical protein
MGVAGTVLMTAGCTVADTGPDKIAAHYEGGNFQSQKFKGCVNPSEKHHFGPGDHVYEYPTREVSYDASDSPDAETKPFKSVSNDNAEMYISVSVVTSLKPTCDNIRKLHERWGKQYTAYYDGDKASDGWVRLLNFGIGKPLDAELDRVVHQYNWRQLWNDTSTKAKVEQEVSKDLKALVNRQLQGDYFEDFSVLVQKPDPVNPDLKQATADEQTAVSKANSKLAQANADKLAAQAQVAVAQAEAASKKAMINVLGVDGYIKEKMVERGLNPYQPPMINPGAQAPGQ